MQARMKNPAMVLGAMEPFQAFRLNATTRQVAGAWG